MIERKPTALVVDDDPATCEMVRDFLDSVDIEVLAANDSNRALDIARSEDLDAVISDVQLGTDSGLELCETLTELHPGVPVIVMTAYGSMETAIAALRVGAYDFVNKPLDLAAFVHTTQRAIEHKRLRDEVAQLRSARTRAETPQPFIGECAAMKTVYRLIEDVGPTDASVLVTGESGTGKELVARAIHDASKRSDGPFVAINCAAMPANLLESELFGHVKGAFTDAKSNHDGLFVRANKGTLFLDEIGEMPVEMQAKLLRVLEDNRVRPVGGDTEVEFDTRIICATNRDLDSEIEEGTFREDLYYRIHVVKIELPPLRSRGRDVLLIAQHALEKVAASANKDVVGIRADAAKKLLEYDWPGNVRELQNSIERAVTLTRSHDIEVVDLPEKIRSHESTSLVFASDNPDEMPTLGEVERRYIERVLHATQGNKTHAARILGLDRRTLYRKLERFEKSGTD